MPQTQTPRVPGKKTRSTPQAQYVRACETGVIQRLTIFCSEKVSAAEDAVADRLNTAGQRVAYSKVNGASVDENENIVFVGHGGTRGWENDDGSTRLGGKDEWSLVLSLIAITIPDNWSGKVVLLGCRTEALAKAVQTKYEKRKGKQIQVVGSRSKIRATRRKDGNEGVGEVRSDEENRNGNTLTEEWVNVLKETHANENHAQLIATRTRELKEIKSANTVNL